jgi:hypothetical protein
MMDAKGFVAIVRRIVCDGAVRATVRNLEQPPGRRPPRDLVLRSDWYRDLDEHHKRMVMETIRTSVENAIFDLFCVLDGVRVIEDTWEKGAFELRFLKGEAEEVISPSGEYLHELFR